MILHRLPHFRSRDGAVFFLNAARPLPPFSEAAQELFTRLENEGAREIAPGAETEAAQELIDRGVCTPIRPVSEAKPRKPVLVLEPHCDDAALSIGATMWQQREACAFTLVTFASHSNYTSSFSTGRDFFARAEVSDLRCREGEIFMAHLGGHYRVLGLPEATMRYSDTDWSLEFFKAHRTSVAISNNRRAGADVLSRWTEAARTVLYDPAFEEIWIPIGAGTHSDHDLLRNAALSVLMQHPDIMARAKVRLYKDVPYGTDFAEHTDRLVAQLRHDGAVLEEETVDVTETIDRKLDLLGIFASQFKVAHIAPGVRHSAAVGAATGRAVEHFWRLDAAPRKLDTHALFIEAPKAAALRDQLADWRRNGETVRHLTVLALAAAGQWNSDEPLLREMFPNARITVCATPATAAEIALRKSRDTELQALARGTAAWVGLALRMTFRRPMHVLFLGGDKTGQARRLARLWPLHKTLVVEAMDHVALASADEA